MQQGEMNEIFVNGKPTGIQVNIRRGSKTQMPKCSKCAYPGALGYACETCSICAVTILGAKNEAKTDGNRSD